MPNCKILNLFLIIEIRKWFLYNFLENSNERVISNKEHVVEKIILELIGVWTRLLETQEYLNMMLISCIDFIILKCQFWSKVTILIEVAWLPKDTQPAQIPTALRNS